jgi:hypothetical protein
VQRRFVRELLRDGRRLRLRQLVRRLEQVHRQSRERRRVHDGTRLSQRQLRRRRVLQYAVQRSMRGLQRAGQGRCLLTGQRRSSRDTRGVHRVRLRHDVRHSLRRRYHRDLHLSDRRDRVRGERVRGFDRDAHGELQRSRQMRRHAEVVRCLRLRHDRVQDDLQRERGLCEGLLLHGLDVRPRRRSRQAVLGGRHLRDRQLRRRRVLRDGLLWWWFDLRASRSQGAMLEVRRDDLRE